MTWLCPQRLWRCSCHPCKGDSDGNTMSCVYPAVSVPLPGFTFLVQVRGWSGHHTISHGPLSMRLAIPESWVLMRRSLSLPHLREVAGAFLCRTWYSGREVTLFFPWKVPQKMGPGSWGSLGGTTPVRKSLRAVPPEWSGDSGVPCSALGHG